MYQLCMKLKMKYICKYWTVLHRWSTVTFLTIQSHSFPNKDYFLWKKLLLFSLFITANIFIWFKNACKLEEKGQNDLVILWATRRSTKSKCIKGAWQTSKTSKTYSQFTFYKFKCTRSLPTRLWLPLSK